MVLEFPYAVEFVVFFTCACSYPMSTLRYEFIYQTISEELNYTSNYSVQYCAPNQSESDVHRDLANQASKWTMYTTLCSYIPCVVGALVLTSWSDKIGRKKAISFPVVGSLICASAQMLIIFYRFPLYCLIFPQVLYGAFGTYSALLNIGSAHLSDIIKPEDRGRRFTILEVSASLGGGATQIATGYWINASGFIPPSVFIIACAFTALLFVPLLQSGVKSADREGNLARETQPLRTKNPAYGRGYRATISEETTEKNKTKATSRTLWAQLRIVWILYTKEPKSNEDCNSGSTAEIDSQHPRVGRRIWRLWFYARSYSIYMFGVGGIGVFQTMFFVSYPVCFSPGLVGVQAGLGNGLVIGAPFIIIILQNFMKLNGQTILLSGIMARIAFCVIMGIATNALLVFLATSMGMVYNLTTAFMRSEASKLVSPKEQGSVLSVLSGFENFLSTFSPIVFLSLYPATLHISHGFSFLVTALIQCLPFAMILSVWIANKIIYFRRTKV